MERTRTKNSGSKAGQLILAQSFNIGPLEIRYYGVFLVLAIALGYAIAVKRAAAVGIPKKTVEDLLFWLVIFSIIGARAYFVIFHHQELSGWQDIFKIWQGGQSIFGALLGGMAVLLFFSRRHNISFWKLADLAAFSLPLAQAVGRLGNFFNYEAFGGPTSLPWKMFIPEQFRPQGYLNSEYFHPTFLYEMIWNVLAFLVLLFFSRSKKISPKPGILAGIYMSTYGIGRFLLEFLRLDSAYLGAVKVNQAAALLLILAGLFIIIYRAKKDEILQS